MSSCVYVHNTSAEAFPDPFTFDPERWLCDPETYKEREKRMLSFSRGSRACIGIKYVKHRACLFVIRIVLIEADLRWLMILGCV